MIDLVTMVKGKTDQEMVMALSFGQTAQNMWENGKTINDTVMVNSITKIKVF